MKDKRLWILIGSLLLGAVLSSVAGMVGAEGLVWPLTALGQWLRSLSERGTVGNILAWILVLGISAIPLLGLLFREQRSVEKLLLILCSLELLAMQYYMVNPTLLSEELLWMEKDMISHFWAMVSIGTVLATGLAWVLLRLLHRMETGSQLLLPKLLFAAAVAYALFLGWNLVQTLGEQWKALAEGNTEPQRVEKSYLMLGLLAVIHLIPDFIGARVLLLGCDLAGTMDRAPFGEELILLAEGTAQRCKKVAKWSVLLAVGGNLLQMLCFGLVASYEIRVVLPLLTLALCAALFLLCGYFRRAKDVHDDNATII